MQRRTYLKTLVAAGAAAPLMKAADPPARPIQLHVDLSVDPMREKKKLKNFHTIFKPAAVKMPGYVDVQMIKLRSALMGKAPEGVNYRFVLAYQSEELRQKWV